MADTNGRIGFPLTIEGQLERYYSDEKHTERHEVLWHAWNQNKRWITQILEITICSYPSYSKHDESHAQTVLHNIEMILGGERIAQLSASDCFVLLHTVYIHDIGMCITHQDRVDILNNRAFIDMVDEMDEDGESTVYFRKAIDALRKTDYSYDDSLNQVEKAKRLYLDKLEVYYGLIHLIGDFRRVEHGEKAKERLYDWTKKPDKLGSGFSLAGIPQRIFLTIANCARMHTHPDFNAIMELPQEDDGYVSDYIHPRFISVLLQLGDILDLDNNRFHPMMQMFMGNVPKVSQIHYEKHISIRKLHITPHIIEIEADCETQEALRLVRKECDMLKGILKDAGYSWAIICPPGYKGSLPTVDSVNLYMDGRKIPEELVSTQFLISQKKAFSILQGANVYSGPYVFLREFLQNALDATKIQYWNDCVSTYGAYREKTAYREKQDIREKSPYQLEQYISTENYPIEIELELQKKLADGSICDITNADIENLDKGKEPDDTYGVRVRIKDFGTGIDKDSILNISKVGNSRKRERALIESMPEWLRPTAEFGIGLQSAFLVAGSFRCYTRTRSGERYEITFGSGSSSQYEGYINVKPTVLADDTFGTCFEVFVSHEKKRLHQNCCEAWDGKDPFSEKYDNRRPLRHAAELAAQMAIYLNGLVGESLFPVHLRVRKQMGAEIPLNETADNKIENICFSWLPEKGDGERKTKTKEKKETEITGTNGQRPWIENKKSWIFYKEDIKMDPTLICEEIGEDIFLLDFKSARLHIWSKKINSFLLLSAKNLIKREEMSESHEKVEAFNGTKIYYKGIELQVNAIQEDSDFIEYIDIKGDLKRELLNLNRKGFTEQGEKYFEEVISAGLQESIKRVLKYLANKEMREDIKDAEEEVNETAEQKGQENNEEPEYEISRIANQIKGRISTGNGSKEELDKLKKQIISAMILVYLSGLSEYNEIAALGMDGKRTQNGWNVLVTKIKKELAKGLVQNNESEQNFGDKGKEEKERILDVLARNSQFFGILTYTTNGMPSLGQHISFVDLFDKNRKYALLQIRKDTRESWRSYLIEIGREESICNDIRQLIFEKDDEQRKKLCEKIDNWGEKVIRSSKNVEGKEENYRQQFLMDWIIRNVPTVAMFSDDKGNIRVNVLNDEVYPFIYLNDDFKWLIIQRMTEESQKHKIDRFSTIAWQGREFLACNDIPFAAYFVKRGKFSEQSCHKVIFPASSSWLLELNRKVAEAQELQLVKVMKQLLEMLDIRNYLRDEVSKHNFEWQVKTAEILEKVKKKMQTENVLQSIYEFYMDLISLWMKRKGDKNDAHKIGKEFLSEQLLKKEDWKNIFLEIAGIYMGSLSLDDEEVNQARKTVKSLQDNEKFCSICLTIQYFKEGYWRLSLQDEVKNVLQSDRIKDENKGQILRMIQKNKIYPVPADNIRKCYEEFEQEILDFFVPTIYKRVQDEIYDQIKLLNITQ